MIRTPGSQPEATALWFDPKNMTRNKDENMVRIERKEDEIEGMKGVLG